MLNPAMGATIVRELFIQSMGKLESNFPKRKCYFMTDIINSFTEIVAHMTGRRTTSLATPIKEVKRPRVARQGCRIGELFKVLGKPHTLDILHTFIEEPAPRRFGELMDELELSPKTLAQRLRELVRAGLLTRTAYNEIPPRVDYEVTKKAQRLRPIFDVLVAWAAENDLKPMSKLVELTT